MSEFLATARIVVRPDTSRFRRDLEAQLQSAVRTPIRIPVVPVVGVGFAAAAAGTAAFAAAQAQAAAATGVTAAELATATRISAQYTGAVDLSTVALRGQAVAQAEGAVAAKAATTAQVAHARSLKLVTQGALSSTLSLFGVRGATLAASAPFLVAAAAVVGFSKAVKSAADLETELNVFRVTAGATADEMQRMSDSAKQLGRDITLPGVTANQAAEAMTLLAKAGLSVQNSLDAARGTLQLATAAQIDNVSATRLVAGALNSFQLAGSDAVKVADLLTGAAKSSQGEITDMGTALAQASAVSQQFGVSIEDTVTLLTELAQAGLSGGRAGTSLRVAFLRLVNPPADAAKALKKLNVEIRDVQGNLRPQIFTDIAREIEGYTKAQQDATLATIFGTDAIRSAAIIGNKGADAFLQIRDAITESGLAQEQAAARTQGLAGDFENLKNQASTFGLTIGQIATGPLSNLTEGLASVISDTNDAAEQIINFAGSFRNLKTDIENSLGPLAKAVELTEKYIALATPGGQLKGLPAFVRKTSEEFRQLNERAEDFTGFDFVTNPTLKQAKKDVQGLIAELNKSGGSSTVFNDVVSSLIDMQNEMSGGSKEAQAFAGSLQPLIDNLQNLSTSPDVTLPIKLPPGLLDGTAGKEAAKASTTSFKDYWNNADFGLGAFVASFRDAGSDAGNAFVIGLAGVVRGAIKTSKVGGGQQAGLEDLMNQILIGGGGPGTQLANLKQQEANQRKIIAAAVEGLKTLTSSDKGFATLTKAAREGRDKLVQILNEQKQIRDQVSSDVEKAANDAAAAVRKREQALLSQFGLARDQRANVIAAAAQTKGLKDDIKAQEGLAALVRSQIAAVRERISVEGGKVAALAALRAIQIQVKGVLDSLVQQQQDVQKEQRVALLQGISLDIELAQITENQALEVKKRNAKISVLQKALQEEARLHGKTTVAYKEIRNQIAQERAALDEIRKEKQQSNQSFSQASFEFLQAQQGFASNLMGNLIPSGATGGLVGGGSVQSALAPVSSFADGQSKSGPTAGQAQTTNAKLQIIIEQLKELNGETKAPEARRQYSHQYATMDGVGGG